MPPAKPPEVGRLRDRVRVERPDDSQAAGGQVLPVWSPVAEVWAAVEPAAGRELWLAEQVQADATHAVTVYRRADLEQDGTRWRLVVTVLAGRPPGRPRVLNPVAVRPTPDGAFLVLDCREAAAEAG